MLADGLTLLDQSQINRELVEGEDRGTEFPASPDDGQMFQLTAVFGEYQPGIYVYSDRRSGWFEQETNDQNPYDIGLTIFDRPRSADVVAKYIAARTYALPKGFSGSIAKANTAATEDAVFNIRLTDSADNTMDLGTLTFKAGSAWGEFSSVLDERILVMRGEILYIQAPEIRDPTLQNIDVTVVGELVVGGV